MSVSTGIEYWEDGAALATLGRGKKSPRCFYRRSASGRPGPAPSQPNPKWGDVFLSYPSCGRDVETGIALCGVAARQSGGQLTQ
jgi:hypothetical protein